MGAVLAGIAALASSRPSQAQNATDAPGGNDSAYTALRAMGKELGREALDRVVEVTGRDGKPQPSLWKIVLLEPAGGTREIDVAGGKITAQRTESKPPASRAAIHLSDLNLDSSGAFDATDAQARKVHLRFDSVNYVLHASDATGKPQWTLNLLNQEGGDVGAMRLSASDGNIVSIDGRLATGPTPSASPRPVAATSSGRDGDGTTHTRVTEHTTTSTRPRESVASTSNRSVEPHTTTTTTTTVVNAPPPPPPPAAPATATVEAVPDDREEGGLFTRTGRTIDKTNHAVEHTLLRAGAKVQRFFTGHSELDQDQPLPPPRPVPPEDRGD